MAISNTPLTSTEVGAKTDSSFSHAVSRSTELLSCAKTALKIGKAQHANDDDHGGTTWWACQEPNYLALCSWKDQPSNSHLDGICEDGLSLLRTMDVELKQLETLVRRRGHTNDPTEEISASVRRLETDARELSSLVKTGFSFPRATAQYQRHTQLIATWLNTVAAQQTNKLKEILKVRGNVLADQAQRRKLLNPQGPGNRSSSTNNTGPNLASSMMEPKKAAPRAMDTPLFNMAPLPKPPAYSNGHYSNGATPNGVSASPSGSSDIPAYARAGYGASGGGYGGGSAYAGGGYGGTGGGSYYGTGSGGYGATGGPSTAGMRQRRAKGPASSGNYSHNHNDQQQHHEEEDKYQARIQMRQQQRQTESRLQEAQEAEQKLADLSTMFTKMTSLISQQGEVLEKVEDDVEAGLQEVIGGQQEITTLYSIKKGNRGLIIKVFALLIFLIIFMRFYKKK